MMLRKAMAIGAVFLFVFSANAKAAQFELTINGTFADVVSDTLNLNGAGFTAVFSGSTLNNRDSDVTSSTARHSIFDNINANLSISGRPGGSSDFSVSTTGAEARIVNMNGNTIDDRFSLNTFILGGDGTLFDDILYQPLFELGSNFLDTGDLVDDLQLLEIATLSTFGGNSFDVDFNTLSQDKPFAVRELGDLSFSLSTTPVPVPAALPLFGIVVAAFGFMGWRRKKVLSVA